MSVELRRAIIRAMTQLTLALEMDCGTDDEPEALLSVIEAVEEQLGQVARDYRETRAEEADESKFPNW
jgi:hypothetical protein